MKKIIGIVLLVIFVFALISYIDSTTTSDSASAIGEFIPVALTGLIGAYLVFSGRKKK